MPCGRAAYPYAGAIGLLPQREQLAHGGHVKVQFAGVADEIQPGHSGLIVAALLALGARWDGEQSDLLVVADTQRSRRRSAGSRSDRAAGSRDCREGRSTTASDPGFDAGRQAGAEARAGLGQERIPRSMMMVVAASPIAPTITSLSAASRHFCVAMPRSLALPARTMRSRDRVRASARE